MHICEKGFAQCKRSLADCPQCISWGKAAMMATQPGSHWQWRLTSWRMLRQAWSDIMTQVAADPWASAYTIFDILNEPDSHGLGWQANGNNPGVGDLYHKVMTAGYSINPSAPHPEQSLPPAVVSVPSRFDASPWRHTAQYQFPCVRDLTCAQASQST